MKNKIDLFGGLIILPVSIIGDNGNECIFRFALDTGASGTILQTNVLKQIGNKSVLSNSRLISGSKQDEKVDETNLKSLSVYSFVNKRYKVFVKTFPKKLDFIDGVLSYDFFQELNLKLLLDFQDNIISIT